MDELWSGMECYFILFRETRPCYYKKVWLSLFHLSFVSLKKVKAIQKLHYNTLWFFFSPVGWALNMVMVIFYGMVCKVIPMILKTKYSRRARSLWWLLMPWQCKSTMVLTHWGQEIHIRISKQSIIGSDNGLSPGQHQASIRTNPVILSIGHIGTHFNEISIEIHIFSFKKLHFQMSRKWQPFCLGLKGLIM